MKLLNLMYRDDYVRGQRCPNEARSYEILYRCGRGGSAEVFCARCVTLKRKVAVKIVNGEDCHLDNLVREVQVMRTCRHPNVLPLYCSFVDGEKLWIVTPFAAAGSVLSVMTDAFREGLDESAIAIIGGKVLRGLDCIHKNGYIHLNIKADDILIGRDGRVMIADFGAAVKLEHGCAGTRRCTTPEMMSQEASGYGTSADIRSFGILLLEMCHGPTPNRAYLDKTAPLLEDRGEKRFSEGLKDLVALCLDKDKQTTAAKLLAHNFFKGWKGDKKGKEYVKSNLLRALPSGSKRMSSGMAMHDQRPTHEVDVHTFWNDTRSEVVVVEVTESEVAMVDTWLTPNGRLRICPSA